jgi:hypothetical protein
MEVRLFCTPLLFFLKDQGHIPQSFSLGVKRKMAAAGRRGER